MDNVIIYDKLEELNEGIEYNGGGINALLSGRVVKRIQRGNSRIVTTDMRKSSYTHTINISPIDTTKSVLLLESNFETMHNDSNDIGKTFTINLEANKITVGFNYNIDNYYKSIVALFFWQVIEFY